MALADKGYLTLEELKENIAAYPSEERFAKGPVAVVECTKDIPCNPCEAACRFEAIEIGQPITNLPYIHEDKCTGCGTCIAQCSGMAIFVLDKTYSEDKGTVSFPYEYLPMPKAGDKVKGVNRAGEVVCDAEVVKVLNPKSFDRTPVVTIAIPKDQVEEVRSIKRRAADTNFVLKQIEDGTAEDDILVCRCEEVTLGEIKKAIADGARTVTGVKLRTRAGMGLCQGRTCGKMVQAILRQQLGNTSEEISFSTNRPPVRPTTFGSIAGGDDNE